MEGVAGGDERWVHVLYFLSRDGKVEQPHLMRVLPRRRRRRDAALRLRDVKRWMSELRGMGMPDSFAWACKRRYKTGYVWEDLADDDAITPVSGGEYVLMGSIVTAAAAATEPTSSSSSSSTTFSSAAATARSAVETASATLADPKTRRPYEKPAADNPDRDHAASPTPPPRAAADDDDEEEEQEQKEEVVVGEAAIQNPIRHAAAAFRAGPDHRAGGAASATGSELEEADPTSSGDEDAGGEGGRGGGRHPRAFWNLLGCGADAVRTHDSALLPLNPRRRRDEGAGGSYCNSRRCYGGAQAEPAGEREARRSRGGGGSPSRSISGGAAADQGKKTAAAAAAATVMASKPVACPLCWQCGRSFRPERLHSHMKSCRALKGQRKSMGSGKLQQRAGAERQPHCVS